MNSLHLWGALGIGFIFLMTGLGAASVLILPEKKLSRIKSALMGFSGGVMGAASVWSLLIPAMEQTAKAGSVPVWLPASGGLIMGALFVACLELKWTERRDDSLLFAAVTLHNIPEGMAVGLAFALSFQGESMAAALALAFGIGIQNFPEGAAVALPMVGQGRGRAFLRGLASGAVEPVFALCALLLPSVLRPAMPWLLSISAGAMLFVSQRELLPEAKGLCGSFGYIFGFVLMMFLDVCLG